MFKSLFDSGYRELKELKNRQKIDALQEDYKKFSDEELKAQTDIFRQRLKNGETMDDILGLSPR